MNPYNPVSDKRFTFSLNEYLFVATEGSFPRLGPELWISAPISGEFNLEKNYAAELKKLH